MESATATRRCEPDTTYAYLVNAHWRADAEYQHVNLADETLAIEWPIALDDVPLSEKDRAHPRLDSVRPRCASTCRWSSAATGSWGGRCGG